MSIKLIFSLLPSVVELHALLQRVYGWSLTLEDCGHTTIQQLIDSAPAELQQSFEMLFNKYIQLWNFIRADIQRFECEQVRVPEITFDSPIAMILVSKEHSPLAESILKQLVAIHNRILQSVSDHSARILPLNESPKLPLPAVTHQHSIGSTALHATLQYLVCQLASRSVKQELANANYFGTFSWNLRALEEVLIDKFFLTKMYFDDDVSELEFRFRTTIRDDVENYIKQLDLPKGLRNCFVVITN